MKAYIGDCLDKMYDIWDSSIDLIICDPPYGITGNKWDRVIDPSYLMWHLIRIAKPSAAILIFGKEPFLSKIRMSSPEFYRYDLVWKKSRCDSYVHADCMPLQEAEYIAVFSKGNVSNRSSSRMKFNPNFGKHQRNVLDFPNEKLTRQFHPTQKPLDLIRELVKWYSAKGDIILDPTCGSGTTLVAAMLEDRDAIGIDITPEYIQITKERLRDPFMSKRLASFGKKRKPYRPRNQK